MNKEGIEERDDDMLSELRIWAESVRLTKQESAAIQHAVMDGDRHRKWWLERMSARIDRSVARTQRRIDLALARNGS
jgi:hypothetical protein